MSSWLLYFCSSERPLLLLSGVDVLEAARLERSAVEEIEDAGGGDGNRSWGSACSVLAALFFGLDDNAGESRNSEVDEGCDRRRPEDW